MRLCELKKHLFGVWLLSVVFGVLPIPLPNKPT